MEQDQVQEAILKYESRGLKTWKDIPLRIGVTGRSGAGKSSFINAIRGLSKRDEGAAEVGVTTTTTTATEYRHPKNDKLILCDLPGVGSSTFPKSTYLTDERIQFDSFIMFLILAADRFVEDDLWLAKEIQDRHKGFFFIRTKLDQAVESESSMLNPNDVIAKIRQECEKNLNVVFHDINITQRVFLIDSYSPGNSLYDFGSLTEQLVEHSSLFIKDALLLSLLSLTPNVMQEKEKMLRGRIMKHFMVSVLYLAFTRRSNEIDTELIRKEALFYRQQLGLSADYLEHLPIELASRSIQLTREGILQLCNASGIGFDGPYNTNSLLKKFLDMMLNDANKLHEYIVKESTTFL